MSTSPSPVSSPSHKRSSSDAELPAAKRPRATTAVCGICHSDFEMLAELYQHVETHVISASPRGTCSWKSCRQPYHSVPELRRHLTRHTGEKQFLCQFKLEDGSTCNAAFKTQRGLEGHARHHVGEQAYVCSFPQADGTICEARFESNRACQQHRRKHAGAPKIARDKLTRPGSFVCDFVHPDGSKCGISFHAQNAREGTLHCTPRSTRISVHFATNTSSVSMFSSLESNAVST
eukprot:m.158010 g.158010  ORF g.158010 m.158010 type:complete len:234 (-) comp10242_c0_seq1:1028-1729(-)